MRNALCCKVLTLGLSAGLPLLLSASSVAQTPAPAPAPPPIMAPSLPPNVEIDLMTDQGSAMFGAQWKTMEAKIVEWRRSLGHIRPRDRPSSQPIIAPKTVPDIQSRRTQRWRNPRAT